MKVKDASIQANSGANRIVPIAITIRGRATKNRRKCFLLAEQNLKNMLRILKNVFHEL